MKVSSVRSALYLAGRLLGDEQAVSKSIRTGSPRPVVKRAERRILGRVAGRAIRRIVR